MPYSACVRCPDCDGFPCLVHAKSDAEMIAVRPAIEHENVTLLRNAEARGADARTRRATPSPRCSSSATAQQETYSADIVVVSCGAANSAKLLLASANERHPRGLANGIGPGRAQLHVPQQRRRARALARAEPDGLPEDARASTTSTSRARTSTYPLGNIQMVGKSQAPMFRGEKPLETKLAPGLEPRGHRQARRRLLALERGPAGRREPRHAERRRSRQALLQGDQRGAPQAPLRAAALDARPAGHAPDAPHPASRLPAEPDSRGRRAPTRRAHAASAATRSPPCSTSTARHTSSTTCTSSTRASSRASAPSTRR